MATPRWRRRSPTGRWRSGAGRAYGELAYEEFLRAESERLEERTLAALEARLDAAARAWAGTWSVLGEALALAEQNPSHERVQELAMLALYRCGRQTEALDHYAAVRPVCVDELGLEPGPELRELQRRILQQDPELSVEAGRTTEAAGLCPCRRTRSWVVSASWSSCVRLSPGARRG